MTAFVICVGSSLLSKTADVTYINFQTKSGHLTDPVGEAIDPFEHTLDKTALVWFQMNRSKFKDLTTLKTMFLQ